VGVGGIALVAGLTIAGPLDPPAGPVSPTYKTLAEVEPRIAVSPANTPGSATAVFTISQPGSYYLTGDITGEPAKHAIEITVGGVTLDLMGFHLTGVAGSLDGVRAVGLGDIAVVNGSVRNCGAIGVHLNNTANVRLADLRVSGCTSIGIITGDTAVVTECSARSNGSIGISVGVASAVRHCVARSNGAHGISVGSDSIIIGCTASSNTINGISASFGTTISQCSARFNQGSGFNISSGSVIECCTAQSSTLDGIRATGESIIRNNVCDSNGVSTGDGAGIHVTFGDNRIEGNSCTRNDRGIDVDAAGNIVVRNTCSGNTGVNWAIVVGNAVAPIVQAATNAAAISGSTYAGALGSADPNANFTY
jgi:parallel beta-helix repeat protein